MLALLSKTMICASNIHCACVMVHLSIYISLFPAMTQNRGIMTLILNALIWRIAMSGHCVPLPLLLLQSVPRPRSLLGTHPTPGGSQLYQHDLLRTTFPEVQHIPPVSSLHRQVCLHQDISVWYQWCIGRSTTKCFQDRS